MALSYLVGGTSREEEGRCRLNPDPGRRKGRVSLFLLAPGSFRRDTRDHAAVDAQIVQFAGRKVRQLAYRLAIDSAACAGFLQPSKHADDAGAGGTLFTDSAGVGVRCSHCLIASHLFVSTSRPIRFVVGLKMAQLLRLHNDLFSHCCYAESARRVGDFLSM